MLKGEHSVILWTFIKLPVSIKTCILSAFKCLLMTDFTVAGFVMHTFKFYLPNVLKKTEGKA